MNLDRAELTGAGAAVVVHVALIAALSMSLASVNSAPEPPSMEVELIDEVGLQSAAPEPSTPPPLSQSPEIGTAEPAEAAPVIQPAPAPSITPSRAKPQPAKPAPRVSRIGDDFLKGIEESSSAARSSKPAAATFDAKAQASVAQLIANQIRPCALQQRELGPGANRIQVVLNLQLFPSGRLKRSPTLVRVTGDDEENAKFVDLVVNQAIASYRQCSPLRLPAELYHTPQGGWANINMKYRVP
jgi:hypothetical protein